MLSSQSLTVIEKKLFQWCWELWHALNMPIIQSYITFVSRRSNFCFLALSSFTFSAILRFSAIVFSDCLTASSLFCLCTAIKAPTCNLRYFLILGPHSAMVLSGHGKDLRYWDCLSKSLKRLFKRGFESSHKAEQTFPHLHWQNIWHLQDPFRVIVGVVWEFLLTNCCFRSHLLLFLHSQYLNLYSQTHHLPELFHDLNVVGKKNLDVSAIMQMCDSVVIKQ